MLDAYSVNIVFLFSFRLCVCVCHTAIISSIDSSNHMFILNLRMLKFPRNDALSQRTTNYLLSIPFCFNRSSQRKKRTRRCDVIVLAHSLYLY